MPTTFSRIKVLNQPGFKFTGPQFTQDGFDAADRIYTALCGGGLCKDNFVELRKTAKSNAIKIFELCYQHKSMYQTRRDNIESVYQAVSHLCNLHVDVNWRNIRCIVEAYITARNNHINANLRSKSSPLTYVVDKFMEVWSAAKRFRELRAQGRGNSKAHQHSR